MKKQTIQLIFGFFLIFSAFSVNAEFLPQADYDYLSGCGSHFATPELACSASTRTTCGTLQNCSACPNDPTKRYLTCVTQSLTYATCQRNAQGIYACNCNEGTYQNTSTGLVTTTTTCTPNYATPSDDILAYAIGAGLIVGGSASAFATCSLGPNPACIASALAAAAGAGLALSAYNSDGTPAAAPNPDPCDGKNCVTVQLDPNQPLTGSGVTKDNQGNIKAPSDFTNNGDGTFSKTSNNDDGSTTTTIIDEVNDRMTSTTTTSQGSYSTALQFGLDSNGLPTTSKVSQWTNAAGDTTYQQKATFDQNGVQTDQSEFKEGTGAIGGGSTGGGTGDTGGGTGDTGSGTGSGGDCATYGCAKEVTLKEIRDELKNTYYDEAQGVKTDINDLADEGINEAADRMDTMLQDMIDELGLDELFDEILDNLPIQQLIETNASNCSYGFSLLGKPYELSICQYQGTIHSVIAFLFFIALSFGIVSLIFERPQGSDQGALWVGI